MNMSEIAKKAKELAGGKNYGRAMAQALLNSGFRPGQQWGSTRNLTLDIPSIQKPDDRTTLLTILAQCLGQEGAQAAARNRQHEVLNGQQLALSI